MPSARPSPIARLPSQNSPLKRSGSSARRAPRRSRIRSLKLSWIPSCTRRRRPRSSGFTARKGSSSDFFSPAVIEPALDSELRDRLLKAEAGIDDSDAADDGVVVHEDLVRRRREPVAAGRGDVLDEGHHGHVALRGQGADAVVDERRLRRRAARRVDLQRDGLEPRLAEGPLQQGPRALHADAPAEHAGPADHAGKAHDRNHRRRAAKSHAHQHAAQHSGSSSRRSRVAPPRRTRSAVWA